ncbi:hypothetical protein P8452_22217 [Trifolium repens]|jgi:hypothetical protein|nr:hypothetical protein P8452_22217 [Trifolium repens]
MGLKLQIKLSNYKFALFFPSDNRLRFIVIQKVFRRSNMSELLRQIDFTQREKSVNSLVYKIEARLRDSIKGGFNFAHNFEHKLKEVQQKIKSVKSELAKYLTP